MKYSKLLNLGDILSHAPTHVIMRRSGIFPNYEAGTDIDILVMDMHKMIDYITRYIPNYTRYYISPTHIQIDHWAAPKQLDLKFDLYSEHISERLTNEILATKVELTTAYAGEEAQKFWVPQIMMDNILKAYEWTVNHKTKYKEFARYEPLLKPYL